MIYMFRGAGKSIFLVSDSESFMYHFLLASVHHSWANLVNSGGFFLIYILFPFIIFPGIIIYTESFSSAHKYLVVSSI